MIKIGISQFIYSWLKDLVILFIIISLIDLIMPKGNMKKYINFVIGLLVIFTVINPFVNMGRINFDLDKEVLKNLEGTISTYDESIIKEQEKQIEDLYKKKLWGEIEKIVNENTKYSINHMDIHLDGGEGRFDSISSINIILKDMEEKPRESNINIEIKQVGSMEKKIDNDDSYLFYELKTLIASKLDIEADSIQISREKQGG